MISNRKDKCKYKNKSIRGDLTIIIFCFECIVVDRSKLCTFPWYMYMYLAVLFPVKHSIIYVAMPLYIIFIYIFPVEYRIQNFLS